MKKILFLAGLIVVGLLSVPYATADPDIPLRVVAQDETTLTLGWDAVEGAQGYRFTRAGTASRSHTWNPDRNFVRFSKGAEFYLVEALTVLDSGRFPNVTPPPPDPEPTSNCLVSNFQSWEVDDCEFGTLIERTNQAWECTQPIASYGPLPIKVVVHSNRAWDSGWGLSAGNGCRGDGNPDTIDLIGIVEGTGNGPGAVGVGQDAFKTRGADNGPRDIQITGRFECGPVSPGAHQDMVQWQGGTNVTLVNVTSGNWNAGTSTCRGAGGVIYTNGGINNNILGSFFVGCNHGIVGGDAQQNEIRDSGSRAGRTDGTDPSCGATGGGSHPCGAGPTYIRTVCQSWDAATDTWRNR